MARITNFLTRHILAIGIGVVLFVIPFFWFSDGSLDIGGDSSRLYFIDPFAYLQYDSLYGVSPSNTNGVNLGFYTIPIVLLILTVKSVLVSPATTIAFFHGMKLSIAFLSVYAIVTLMLMDISKKKHEVLGKLSSIFSGLFYVFTPALSNYWDKAILTHDQLFLNPLMFLLIFLFFRTRRVVFAGLILLTTLLFSHNFDLIVAAPPMFSFYPISVIFISLYTVILKQRIPWGKATIVLGTFFGIHAFHLYPALSEIFSTQSTINQTIFSEAGKINRGLSYFNGVVGSISPSSNFFRMEQNSETDWYIFSVSLFFPLLLVVGLFLNKTRLYLLSLVMFLIIFYLTSANITYAGVELYRLFYKLIPGFAMFRNFYGQWHMTFIFYYALVISQAIFILLQYFSIGRAKLSIVLAIILIMVTAMPFITGSSIRKTWWESDSVSQAVSGIDPDLEEILNAVNELPDNGRLLTLPLSDPGYQIVAGVRGGAYQGPSVISYLTKKSDFAGIVEFGVYSDVFIRAVGEGNTDLALMILSMLQVHYIYYNEDPAVYDDNFPTFPYSHAKAFLPPDQESYKKFLSELDLKLIHKSGSYHLYELPEEYHKSRVYAADRLVLIEDGLEDMDVLSQNHILFQEYKNSNGEYVLTTDNDIKDYVDITYISPVKNNAFSIFELIKDFEYGGLFVSHKPDDLLYPAVVMKEYLTTSNIRPVDQISFQHGIKQYLFFGRKRLYELERWGREIPVIKNIDEFERKKVEMRQFVPTESIKHPDYNSWEAAYARYTILIQTAIDLIHKADMTEDQYAMYAMLLEGTILDNYSQMARYIKQYEYDNEMFMYLDNLNTLAATQLTDQLSYTIPEFNTIDYIFYNAPTPGQYDMYINDTSLAGIPIETLRVTYNDQHIVYSSKASDIRRMVRYGTIDLQNTSGADTLTVTVENIPNVAASTDWMSSNELENIENGLYVSYPISEIREGFIKEIDTWVPRHDYVVTFSYKSGNGVLVSNIIEINEQKNTYINRRSNQYDYNYIFKKNLMPTNEWKEYTQIVQSLDADKAIVHMVHDGVIPGGNSQISDTAINDFAIYPVLSPDVVLRSENDSQLTSPDISFEMINPTRFKVEIANVTGTYLLTFLNQYSPDWRIYKADPSAPNSLMSRILTRLPVLITDEYHPTKGAELSSQHVQVNGYANAWLITPEDTHGETAYTLYIDLKTQQYFYRGILMTLASVVLLLIAGAGYFIYNKIRS